MGTTKKLLVTGGSGDLGRVLCARAAAAGYEVYGTYLTHPERIKVGEAVQLDLCDRDAVRQTIGSVRPDYIVHTAVPSVNVPNLRQNIVTAAYHLSSIFGRADLIFLSTDMVFDGTSAPYKDDDPPSPRSVYGQAKAEMEMMSDRVVRTSLIYDFEPGNKQIDWMLEKLNKGEKIRLFSDEYRSPIWVENLADVLLELLDSPFTGILNVGGPMPISRLDLGWQLLEMLGYDPDQVVESVSQAGSGRPADLTLDVSKAEALLKTPLLNFDAALSRWHDAHAE